MKNLTNAEAIKKKEEGNLFLSAPSFLILFNDESSVLNSEDLLSNKGKMVLQETLFSAISLP